MVHENEYAGNGTNGTKSKVSNDDMPDKSIRQPTHNGIPVNTTQKQRAPQASHSRHHPKQYTGVNTSQSRSHTTRQHQGGNGKHVIKTIKKGRPMPSIKKRENKTTQQSSQRKLGKQRNQRKPVSSSKERGRILRGGSRKPNRNFVSDNPNFVPSPSFNAYDDDQIDKKRSVQSNGLESVNKNVTRNIPLQKAKPPRDERVRQSPTPFLPAPQPKFNKDNPSSAVSPFLGSTQVQQNEQAPELPKYTGFLGEHDSVRHSKAEMEKEHVTLRQQMKQDARARVQGPLKGRKPAFSNLTDQMVSKTSRFWGEAEVFSSSENPKYQNHKAWGQDSDDEDDDLKSLASTASSQTSLRNDHEQEFDSIPLHDALSISRKLQKFDPPPAPVEGDGFRSVASNIGRSAQNNIRRMVSRNRERYVDKENGYDLDLTMITNRIIAMSFPSSGFEKLYRNAASEVHRFFESKFAGNYRIYNLCINRRYPESSELQDHVEPFGFFDHNACPMQLLRRVCLSVESWLEADPNHVAAIHCKAGKGRTGLVVASFLMHSKVVNDADSAIRLFGLRRTKDGKGITIPSQHRYVRYYEWALKNERLMKRIEMDASRSVIFQMVGFTFHNVDPHWPPNGAVARIRLLDPRGFLIFKTDREDYFASEIDSRAKSTPSRYTNSPLETSNFLGETAHNYKTEHVQDGIDYAIIKPKKPIAVQGDVRVQILLDNRGKGKTRPSRSLLTENKVNIGQCWFNTNFLYVNPDIQNGGSDTNLTWKSNSSHNGSVAAGDLDPEVLGAGRLKSSLSFLKIELDGLRKDRKHKLCRSDFRFTVHLVAGKNQPGMK